MLEREQRCGEYAETTDLNVLEPGSDTRLGFITSGPAYTHVREVYMGEGGVIASAKPDTLMIDATHLKAHRTASSLGLKKGGVAA